MLPVSGVTLAISEPTGEDELFVVETDLAPLGAILELLRRLTRGVDWDGLPAVDLDAAALLLRRRLIGEIIRTDAGCANSGCAERIDVSFAIADYLNHHHPRSARAVRGAGSDGWLELTAADTRFRVPTVADVREAAGAEDPAAILEGRCTRPAGPPRSVGRRIDRALSALAPSLKDLVGGSCPVCGVEVALWFDPLAYVLTELRDRFAGIHADTHALASAYGWSEHTILAMPGVRRRRYAELVSEARAAA